MHADNLTCEDIHTGPTVTGRVFHWEHLSQKARTQIYDIINNEIDTTVSNNISPGSDILEVEVVVQVTIHTQIAEY